MMLVCARLLAIHVEVANSTVEDRKPRRKDNMGREEGWWADETSRLQIDS